MPSVTLEMPSKQPVRFLLVGIGPHAKRTFIKHMKDLASSQRGTIVAAIDILANKRSLSQYAATHLPSAELVFVPPFSQTMPELVREHLTRLVHRLQVDCVIISTEPECHKPYGLWALALGLHVIMDKPITTRRDACNSMRQAAGIADDYNELLDAYTALQAHKRTFFLINSHRRYHPGYYGTTEFIDDIRARTGCPVTSLISTHCDGQWRLPAEVVEQHYHPFRYGYGKVSHSGYHFLDTAYRFLRAGWDADKRPDEIEVVSTFVRPNDFLGAFTNQEHRRALGAQEYDEHCKYSDEELRWLMHDMGEMDAMLQITFKRGGLSVAVAQLNLFHNGFARRSWIEHPLPHSTLAGSGGGDDEQGPDLYKGCGRVKHEAHEIRSGPFQTVVIDSRQANDRHDRSKPSTRELGSDNHFEVQVWRNCGMLGEGEPLRVYTVADLEERRRRREREGQQMEQEREQVEKGKQQQQQQQQQKDNTKMPGLLVENVKRGILSEALDFLDGVKGMDDLASNLPDHSIPASLMSAAYVSHVRRTAGLNPITHIDISYPNESRNSVGRATLRATDLVVHPPTSPSDSPTPVTPGLPGFSGGMNSGMPMLQDPEAVGLFSKALERSGARDYLGV